VFEPARCRGRSRRTAADRDNRLVRLPVRAGYVEFSILWRVRVAVIDLELAVLVMPNGTANDLSLGLSTAAVVAQRFEGGSDLVRANGICERKACDTLRLLDLRWIATLNEVNQRVGDFGALAVLRECILALLEHLQGEIVLPV
jgi:hypothetical protein